MNQTQQARIETILQYILGEESFDILIEKLDSCFDLLDLGVITNPLEQEIWNHLSEQTALSIWAAWRYVAKEDANHGFSFHALVSILNDELNAGKRLNWEDCKPRDLVESKINGNEESWILTRSDEDDSYGATSLRTGVSMIGFVELYGVVEHLDFLSSEPLQIYSPAGFEISIKNKLSAET